MANPNGDVQMDEQLQNVDQLPTAAQWRQLQARLNQQTEELNRIRAQAQAQQQAPPNNNVHRPEGTPQELLRCEKAMSTMPKYARTTPWRQYVLEFQSWIQAYRIENAGDNFIKNAIVMSMKGQAQDIIVAHRAGSATFQNNVTWRDYANAIEGIFAPKAESQLAKQEFRSYKQGPKEDMTSYFQTKRALFNTAYPNNTGPFDTFHEEVIKGICSREVKKYVRMSPVRNAEELERVCVRTVADVRSMFEDGYADSESRDGLYHSTIMGIKTNQDEPMDIGSMKQKVRELTDQISAMKTGKDGVKCYNCNKFGHMARDCRSKKAEGGKGGFKGKGKHQSGGSGGGKFKGNCNNCGKYGHRASECRSKKKDGKDEKNGKIKKVEEEEEAKEDSSGYTPFLRHREEEN